MSIQIDSNKEVSSNKDDSLKEDGSSKGFYFYSGEDSYEDYLKDNQSLKYNIDEYIIFNGSLLNLKTEKYEYYFINKEGEMIQTRYAIDFLRGDNNLLKGDKIHFLIPINENEKSKAFMTKGLERFIKDGKLFIKKGSNGNNPPLNYKGSNGSNRDAIFGGKRRTNKRKNKKTRRSKRRYHKKKIIHFF